jgi:thioredoxin reductase (NADPH)
MQQFDLIIIGAGPTGLSCAIEAEKAGLHYLVVEKGVLVNSIYNFPTNMTFFSTSKLLEIGDTPFISHSDKPTRMEALEYYRRIAEKWKLNINLYEEVKALLPQTDQSYILKTNRGEYHTESVIVSTGFYDTPRMLNIPGEELSKVRHYYDDPHPYAKQKVLVIGAANSACDVALETYYKGAEVTMAIRESEIYPKVKYWIRPNIVNRIKEGSITAYFKTTVKEIRPTEVVLNTPEGEKTIANDFVLAMTGYQPNYPLLEGLGIHIGDDHFNVPDHHPESLETNLPNVFVAGVICAGKQTSKLFIENTRDHGAVIVQQILEKKKVPTA